jgi:hypothetical protein
MLPPPDAQPDSSDSRLKGHDCSSALEIINLTKMEFLPNTKM